MYYPLQVTGAASKASDTAGSKTPDVNVPGFGPFKFNPKEDAKQAAKKSPLGFMNVGELAFDLPGSGVSKDDLPNNVKPGDAAGLPKGPTAKPPSLPSLPKVWSSCILRQMIYKHTLQHVLAYSKAYKVT